MSLGTGLAFSHKYTGDGGVCLAYFGDGAANQGQVYESFNMAELWKLPVIYVIENNQYAMGTQRRTRSSPRTSSIAAARASAFPASRSTAWTCSPCRGAAEEALAWVRAGKGPIILEMKTYRYRGHSMSDPAKYRTPRGSPGGARQVRPDRARPKKLLEKLGVNEDELKEIERRSGRS